MASNKGFSVVLILTRAETTDEIGIDGTIKFITDLGLALEDPVVLCIAYQLEAKEMGRFTRSGFVKGWSMAKCSSIADMKSSVAEMKSSMAHDDNYFSDVYKFTFAFNLNDGQRLLREYMTDSVVDPMFLAFIPLDIAVNMNFAEHRKAGILPA